MTREKACHSFLMRDLLHRNKFLFLTYLCIKFIFFLNYFCIKSLNIIDDIMYMPLTDEQLQYLYRKLIFLNESRRIIFITNRELNEQTKLENFDRDVFEKLVEKIIIKGKDNIVFEFKDGTSIKAEIEL